MQKKNENYLHLYFKQWGTISNSKVPHYEDGNQALSAQILHHAMIGNLVFTPHLRPLSDITEKEMGELHLLWFGESSRDIYTATFNEVKFKPMELKRPTLHGSGIGYSAFDKNGKHIQTGTLSLSRLNSEQFHYLLKQGFDFFGLIEAGLAVDKTKEGK